MSDEIRDLRGVEVCSVHRDNSVIITGAEYLRKLANPASALQAMDRGGDMSTTYDEAYDELCSLLQAYDDTGGDTDAWRRFQHRRSQLMGMGGDAARAAERHQENMEEAASTRGYW